MFIHVSMDLHTSNHDFVVVEYARKYEYTWAFLLVLFTDTKHALGLFIFWQFACVLACMYACTCESEIYCCIDAQAHVWEQFSTVCVCVCVCGWVGGWVGGCVDVISLCLHIFDWCMLLFISKHSSDQHHACVYGLFTCTHTVEKNIEKQAAQPFAMCGRHPRSKMNVSGEHMRPRSQRHDTCVKVSHTLVLFFARAFILH